MLDGASERGCAPRAGADEGAPRGEEVGKWRGDELAGAARLAATGGGWQSDHIRAFPEARRRFACGVPATDDEGKCSGDEERGFGSDMMSGEIR